MKIAHIINPVKVTDTSDLFIAQPVTFETMRRAKKQGKSSGLEIGLFYTCFEEDLTIAPKDFMQTDLLTRCVMDTGHFKKERKLPLIKDILDRLYDESDADYFIYTNVDIALMPDFYTKVEEIIQEGFDGFVINRRTISNTFTAVDEIEQMYADKGTKHPGYDCFVFKREVYPKYDLRTACIGANWIGRVLISNVIAHSKQFKVFEDEHQSFHIGDDRSWKIDAFSDFDLHNENIVISILSKMLEEDPFRSKPLLEKFYADHTKKSINDVALERIIKYHTTVHEMLPDRPEKVYGQKYKPSTKWDTPIILRQDPVFVIGYPRSGTTLLQILLATQKRIFSLPEVHFFQIIRKELQVENDRIQSRCLDDLIKTIRTRIVFSINAEEHIRTLSDKGELSPKMLYEIIVIDNVIDKMNIDDITTSRWLEKTPDNGLFLDLIFRYYPNAKIVNIVRNPEKAILSRKKYFKGEDQWPIHLHVEKWIESLDKAEKFAKLYPGHLLTVRLEDLVADKKDVMQHVCRHLDIDFDEQLLANQKEISEQYFLPWETWKSDTRQELSQDLAERKEKEFSLDDKQKLYCQAKEKLEKYGYLDGLKHQVKAERCFNTTSLMKALKELTRISFLKHPILKYKAYKKMLSIYDILKHHA